MRARGLLIPAVLAGLITGAGCRSPGLLDAGGSAVPTPTTGAVARIDSPRAAAGELQQASHEEPARLVIESDKHWAPPDDLLLPLSEYDCICRAAANSPEVAIVLLETHLPSASRCRSGPTPAESLRQQLLRLRAAEAANRAAGQALQAFYVLAEALRQRDLAANSLERIEQALADVRTAREQGLAVGDAQALQTQRAEVIARRAEAEAAVVAANTSLKLLLAEPATSAVVYLPQVDELTAPSFEQHQAISSALAQRAELNAVRLLLCNLAADTESMAVGMLQQAYPGSSVPQPPGACSWLSILTFHQDSQTLPLRRRQLQQLLYGLERTTADEVVRAGSDVLKHNELREFAAVDAARSQQRLSETSEERRAGRATYLELIDAELRQAGAESELVRQRFAAEIAFAKLRQAEGALAVACGWIEPCAALSTRVPIADPLPEPVMPLDYETAARESACETAGESAPLKQGIADSLLE